MYKRSIEYHLTNYIAINDLQMDSHLNEEERNLLTEKNCCLKEGLQVRGDAEEEFSEIKSWYCENLKDKITGENYGELVRNFNAYVAQ